MEPPPPLCACLSHYFSLWCGREREREREEAPLVIRATRPHIVGHVGVCDQEEEEIECLRADLEVELLGDLVAEEEVETAAGMDLPLTDKGKSPC